MSITVVLVTPERWPDLIALFATSEVMRGCWCMWPRRPFRQHQTGEENQALLQATVESGKVPDLLAPDPNPLASVLKRSSPANL